MPITYLDNKPQSKITYLDQPPINQPQDSIGQMLLKNLKGAAQETYQEGIAPVLEGASTFAAGIPRLVARMQGKEAEQVVFPEQKTVGGKILRGASEIVGFGAGLPSRAAIATGKAIGKGASMLPGFFGKKLVTKMAQGAGAGAVGMATAGDTVENRLKGAMGGAVLGGVAPVAGKAVTTVGKGISKAGRFVAKNIGGITDSTVKTIKRLGANKVFNPIKEKADYISQDLAPRIHKKLTDIVKVADDAYSKVMNSAPEGKQINVRPAIEEAGSRLRHLGLITKTGNMTELGKSEIARDSVYGKLLDFYKSADAISGVKKLQGKDLTSSQMVKAFNAMRETKVNKEQFLFLRDKLNSLYKNKPSDIDVSKVVNKFYESGEASGLKGLQEARALQRKVFEIEDKIDLNKITRDLIKAKNPQYTKPIEAEYKKILGEENFKDVWDDLMAHYANIDFGLVSETPGAGGGLYPSRSGMIRSGVSTATKGYYQKVIPEVEKFKQFIGRTAQKGMELIK